MGDRSTYPMKGDTVECYYTGRLDSGKVFDTNVDDGLSVCLSVCLSLSVHSMLYCFSLSIVKMMTVIHLTLMYTFHKFFPP